MFKASSPQTAPEPDFNKKIAVRSRVSLPSRPYATTRIVIDHTGKQRVIQIIR
jgi:hypothetical protein